MPTPETINTVSLIIIFILLILTLKNRVYGLLAYTCISITRPGVYFPLLGKIRFEMIVALVMLIIIIVSQERRHLLSLHRNQISRNLFIFFGVVILSMFQALDFQTAFDKTWEFAKIYAFGLLILALVRTDRDLKIFLWTFGILMAWIGYEPIYNFLSGVVTVRGEVSYSVASTGRGAGHVALGIYLVQGLIFLWYLTVSNKNAKQKLTGSFLLIFCLIAIMISGSRGAIVGLVFTSLLISYFSQHRLRYLIASCLIFFVALSSMGSGYLSYMSTILEFGQSDSSAYSRIDGLRHGVEMLVKKPILGVGPGCYPVARKLWFGWGLWSHNIYGQIAGDLGLAGILTWSIFIYSYLKKCFLMRNSLKSDSWYYSILTALIVANIVSLILGFFAHILYGYFWYMSAAIIVVIEDLLIRRKSQPAI